MGKLIVFEGTDGTGKSTQYARACKRLEAQGVRFQNIKFPQYDEPSSALIKMRVNSERTRTPSTPTPRRPFTPLTGTRALRAAGRHFMTRAA